VREIEKEKERDRERERPIIDEKSTERLKHVQIKK